MGRARAASGDGRGSEAGSLWDERVMLDSLDYIEIHRIKDAASIGALVA
jgi:hypothetical protein